MLPVYVLTWNATEWCASSCATIKRSDPSVELTVIDNGSTLPYVDPDARVIRIGKNIGYTGAANVALRDWLDGDEPWCVIAAHDLHVEPDTFTRMLDGASSGVVGPTPLGPPMGGLDRDWVSGLCMMISRDCALVVGRFDERFGSYCEDIDYCHRALRAGFDVRLVDVPVRTLGTASGTGRRQVFASEVLLARKEISWRAAARKWFLHAKVAAYRLLVGDWKVAHEHLYAVVYGARHLARSRHADDSWAAAGKATDRHTG
jgi:GT2 family glycosyltransferase